MNFETIEPKKITLYLGKNRVSIIDLREEEEYQKSHIRTAINIPYYTLIEGDIEFLKGRILVLYCERGSLSLQAARVLSEKGYQVISVYGGFHAINGNYALTKEEKSFIMEG